MKSAGPRLASTARATKPGRKTICQPGAKPYQAITLSRTKRFIAKSTSATTADDDGMMIRGKYTFPMRFALARRLFEASLKMDENKNQGNIPANTMIG